MTAMNVTFLGNDAKDKELTWGPDITLPLNKPVRIDPGAGPLHEHLIRKGKNLPFLKIEEAKGGKPPKPAEEDDEDEDEENGNASLEIPPDFRDMHHKKVIALAKQLGGEGEALATRDGAIAFIEEHLASLAPVPSGVD